MNCLFALLHFYRKFIAWSIVANIIIGSINPNYFSAIITKLFLTAFAWYFFSETDNKQKLTFYKNIGISPLKLFAFIFIIDSILTSAFIFLLKTITTQI